MKLFIELIYERHIDAINNNEMWNRGPWKKHDLKSLNIIPKSAHDYKLEDI